ncbi:hypothetical protein NPIL_455371 [Nephila pilipes]|uniref:Uncharacterized protein n=1 Tax=Nephila pilipes TaxID=299642 RepID=A0A8X6NHN4_NEPPI|nr:hypothetical protein NPIL_669611 [Nephila pilipes]GFT98304.1 hypothetical protein NPIL_455371 [Nephila pilipes]
MKPSIIGTAQINPLGCRPKTSVPPTDCDFVRTSYPGTTRSFREFLILPSQNSFLSPEKGLNPATDSHTFRCHIITRVCGSRAL